MSSTNPAMNNRFVNRNRWIRFGSLFIFLVAAFPGFAQDTASKSFMDDPINNPMTPLYLVTALMFVTVILVLVVAVYMLRILNMFVREAEMERAAKLGKPYVPSVSWWTKMWDELNASVPVAQEQDIDLGHEYDGIRELDNHLPPWWKGILYGSMVFAVVYLVIYHVMGSMPLSKAEYENQLATAAEEIRAYKASQPVADIDEATLKYTADAAILASGSKVFISNNCQQCHRTDGGGNAIGPNLTDTYWIHGGTIQNIFHTINTGVLEKGMPAWGKVMSPTDVRDVAFYIMSLQGSNPKDAKAPQGNLYTPEAVAAPADTVKGGK